MRWTFDVNCRALYVQLADGEPAQQVERPDGTIVDVTRDGAVVGVEILHPSPGSVDLRGLVDEFRLSDADGAALQAVISSVWQVRAGGNRGPISAQIETESETAPSTPEFARA